MEVVCLFAVGQMGQKKLGHMGDARILTADLSSLLSGMVEEHSHTWSVYLECVF